MKTCIECGGRYQDNLAFCPACGKKLVILAEPVQTEENIEPTQPVQVQQQRNIDQTPETIEELKQWYIDHNLPPEENTRFFIGKNYRQPRAFGIYEENGQYIVYKNKNDGSRAIRYSGPDEAYAVNELYQRLKQEIGNQKAGNRAARSAEEEKRHRLKMNIIKLVAAVCFVWVVWAVIHTPDNGYYRHGDTMYYYQSGSWYAYDDYYDWYYIDDPYWADDYSDYYLDDYYDYGYGVSDFEDSEYYDEDSSYSSSDSSWDSSDSWDSGSTDFDSDW